MPSILSRLVLALACLHAADLAAGPMPGSMRSVVSAIQTNVRMAMRPSFTIRSRHAAAVNAVVFAPGGGWFASASENGGVQIWETVTGQKVIDLAGSGPIEHMLLLSPRGGDARAFSRAEPKAEPKAPAPAKAKKAQTTAKAEPAGSPAPAPKMSEADKRPALATVDGSGVVTVWNTATGSPRHRLSGHTGQVAGLALLSGGQLLAAGHDGLFLRWNPDNGSETGRFQIPGRVRHLAASPQGDRASVVMEDGRLLVVDTATGGILFTLAERDAVAGAWSPDSGMVAAALEGGRVAAWGVNGGQRLWEVRGGDADPTAITYSPDGRNLAVADKEQVIRVWSLAGADGARAFSRAQPDAPAAPAAPVATPPGPPKEMRVASGKINALVAAPGGNNVIASAGDDKMVHFWSGTAGNELLRLVALRSGWAAVAPEGFFDGTLDGETEDRIDAVSWDVESRSFSVDGFLENYFRPGLLGRVLSGERMNLAGRPNVQEGFPLPPKISLEVGDSDPATGMVSVMATVEDQGGGVGEVRLFHNGKVVDAARAEEMGATRGGARQIRFKVPVMEGANAIQGVALSKDRIESELAKVLHSHSGGGSAPATMHIFAVGINKYKNPEMNLNFGVPDAKGVRNFFAAAKPSTVARSMVDEIYDERATRNEIRDRLGVLKNTAPQDTVVVYLAGHGESVDDAWYFIPNEVDMGDVDRLNQVALSSGQLRQAISEMGARYILLLLDACKSGAAIDQFAKLDNNRTLAVLSRSTGIHVAAATTGEQYASELGQLGHGLFTFALLEGLKGKADLAPADERISVKELLDYLRVKVPALTKQYHTDMQDPVINMRGDDFIVINKR
ncbi:MAG: caspase family protein [Magnetococcales bacterium]|nr:caspase family protein [Magnetococcales bacterium]